MLQRPTVALLTGEPTFRWTVSRLLEAADYIVTTADCGPTAIGRLMTVRPAAIIVETEYRGAESTMTIVERLRSDATTRTIPVIVCSPDERFLTTWGARLHGRGCDIVGRPFDGERLVALIQGASQRREAVPGSFSSQ